jgi:tetratricopeptide (TPR) repeat protein
LTRRAWFIEALAGNWVEAERAARKGYERLNEYTPGAGSANFAVRLADALYEQGRIDEAETLADEAERLGLRDDLLNEIDWRRVRAKVHAARGRFDEAERLAREAVELVDRTDHVDSQGQVLRDVAEVPFLAGRSEEAAARLAEAIRRYEQKGNIAAAMQARARLAELTPA